MNMLSRLTLSSVLIAPCVVYAQEPVSASVASIPADPIAAHTIALADATRGLKGQGRLVARIEVEQAGRPLGSISCELFEAQAPKAVANFVGLARGLRPFWDDKHRAWERRHFYDGLVFHDVLADFMIQAGDPQGLGTGTPGYTFEDEHVDALRFDRAGMLGMASAGPGTNGSQFFITDKALPHLDGRRTLFGACQPIDLIAKLARVPVGLRRTPIEALVIKKISITRGVTNTAKKAAP